VLTGFYSAFAALLYFVPWYDC